ncbi:TauD/TfdA family dioxygenase [Thalassomonas sp. RHCl1]|uniref:TauD/TfdA family dioxygenase n=1 Tax=Thalassomonas sp. RHCl1 TaxID=2995320 RepID=UPI00248CDA62|nr:TauD/TfdA family dioxygenase [Thalassomonas sp. RHCl1]
MKKFYETPVFEPGQDAESEQYLQVFEAGNFDLGKIKAAIEQNQLVLVRGMPFEHAGDLFGQLVDHYDLRDSYDIQMQLVAHMMEDREAVDDVAVTVNERGPFQMIQSHAEGDSSSPLDLFGLHCRKNAVAGGENILSLVDQNADHSLLKAKEKAIVGRNLTPDNINDLRAEHLDAKDVLETCDGAVRVLKETGAGKVVVRTVPLRQEKSAISGQDLYSHWDNVTVHDHAFHQHQHELLRHLGILNEAKGEHYEGYMHVEGDSDWAPADTRSGTPEQIANLYSCHILYKMQADDFLLFNNKAWSHAVNNWAPEEVRKLTAMYA